MSFRSHPLGNLKSLESVRLGRLVLNTKDPLQDFHDPLEDRPTHLESSIHTQTNYQQTQNFSKSSKLRSYLSDVLSVSREVRGAGTASLIAPQATTHELQNSGSWFQDACKNAGTRKWIEEAVNNDEAVYLVVGFLILKDSKLSKTVTSGTVGGIGVELPVNALAAGTATATAITKLTPGVLCVQNAVYGQVSVFDAPGDQVFAMHYRKVKFKWYSSKKVSNSFLETGSRWKPYWQWRGEDDEGEDEDEDILDASLADDSDLEMPKEDEDDDDDI